MKRTLLFAALIAFPVMSAIAAPVAEKPLMEGKPYAEQRLRIMNDLQGGEVYSEISAENRMRVVDALGRIDALLGKGGHASLPDKDKIEVFNDQDLVNTLLTQAREDSRLVCRRERPVGSNRPQNICITVAARRQARENGADTLRDLRISTQKVENP
ncbi:MAG: hypothetical protein ABS96_24985 [Lysobacteraceae bacterium SCN 69-123]|jgi:hypothetical protein|uniref:hypothetical protein n=1 Tax=Stenotrophomonas acidaminiphila TaxID=128780 RepID=UPI0008689FF9|nr:hypothetical protein [Stenotrophomonas acidaminiphila]MBN8802241.1 hypothetical protein [Stenotrophomonas acidaminiphila]ODU43152.1 MAG: hypothetical protein ABS96_24985 [Xanthomonadaceae bacterium SCN 69-123]OJY79428.1 MAG: hypothetical protein BGP18_01255 [Stenotrophomonas sp. 69-14]